MKLTQEILDSGEWVDENIFKFEGIKHTKFICKQCGEFFLVRSLKSKLKYCSRECYYDSLKGRTGCWKGKVRGPMSEEQKQKQREAMTGRKLSKEYHDSQRGEKNWQYCPYHSNGIPKYDSFIDRLEPHEDCKRSKRDPNILRVRCYNCGEWFVPTLCQVGNRLGSIRNTNKDYNRFYCSKDCKKKCPRYRRQSLYSSQDIPRYDVFAPKLQPYEECQRNIKDSNILEIKCVYCGKWFIPTAKQVSYRIQHLSNDTGKFYCSSECKQECPIYKRVKYYKGQKGFNSREVQPELRQLVLARDDYTCQKCEQVGGSLHCHHIEGVEQNPIESADVDMCITLCKRCHKEVHSENGCRYIDLRGCIEDNQTMVVNI
jgi:5-methylcytosine-specific restriction endonuclease McrA